MTAPASAAGPLDRLIVQVAASINTRALYAANHPRALHGAQGIVDALGVACQARRAGDVTFLIVGDELVVDGKPLRGGGLYQQNFVNTLRRRGVERLTLARGLEAEEAGQFVTSMAAGQAPSSTPHVIVGRVEVATDEAGGGGPQPITSQQLDEAREAFGRFRSDRRGSLHKLEEMVWSLMESLARSARETLALAQLKSHDDYTFVHSVNVSLLVLAQARSFGIEGQLLHTLGIAAACHDVGKLTIPTELINKPGRLGDAEWEIMKSHAEQGAWQLADTTNAPPLAVSVAYEHHMRFDGRPAYPLVARPMRPSLASRMTSLADVYDAVSTARSYARPVSAPVALQMLRDRSGSLLDPFLVGNFHRLVGATPP